MTQLLTPGDGQDIVERFERAHTNRDPDEVMDVFGERIEYHPDPFEPPLLGRIEVRAYWNGLVERQTAVTFEVQRVWVVGRTVLFSWHGGYRREDVSDRIAAEGFVTIEVGAAGLIRRVREWTLTDR
jgi:hypothetical protein